MKRWILPFLLLLLLMEPAWASLPREVEDALPPEAEELWDELDVSDTNALSRGIRLLWDKGGHLLMTELRGSIRGAVTLLLAVLLCGVAEDCFKAAEHPTMMNFVPMAGALVVTAAAAGDLQSMIGLGIRTMEELDVFSKALLPTLAAAVAAGGGIGSAGVHQAATVVFAELLISLIRQVLLPLVYVYIAAATADAMLPGYRLKTVAAGIKKVITWVLTGSLVTFTGYLSLAGATASSADALTVNLTRTAISAAVPVVGGIISGAAETVLAGAVTLKNTLGIAGMLAVLALCLSPFLQMAVQFLLYKLTAFLAGVSASEALGTLIDALGGAFGMMLGMTGSCAMLLLISITSSVSVVMT